MASASAGRIADRHQAAKLAVPEDLRHATHRRRHDRHAGRHRLADDLGHRLGERWMGEHVGAAQQSEVLVEVADIARQPNPARLARRAANSSTRARSGPSPIISS